LPDNIFHPEKVLRITTGRFGNWSASADKCVTHSIGVRELQAKCPDAEYIIPFLFTISCYIYNIYLYLYIFIYIYIFYLFIYLCIYLEYVQHAVEIRPTSCTGVLLQQNLLNTRFGHDQFFTIFCLIIVWYLSMIPSISARLFSCK